MTRLDHFQRIIRSLDTLVDIPVTAKIRTGLKEDVLIAHELIPHIKTWGVSMITLHGRTRQQRYSKLADWNYIDKCSKLCDPIPLVSLFYFFLIKFPYCKDFFCINMLFMKKISSFYVLKIFKAKIRYLLNKKV